MIDARTLFFSASVLFFNSIDTCASTHGFSVKDTAISVDSVYVEQKKKQSSINDQTNPLKICMILMINAYQQVFSKLDGSSCQFRPSCSHFGVLAIKHKGPVQGILMTGDRLIRCNHFTRGKYKLAPDNLHHLDPVEDHDL